MAAVESTPVPTFTTNLKVAKSDKKQSNKNKDLQKTRLCVYNLEGKCGYGSDCTFAHSAAEVKDVPDLKKTQLCAKFALGQCNDNNCSFAHGEAELKDPPNFKKKLCKWYAKGVCRNGATCGFAHAADELRADPPPGLTLDDSEMQQAFNPKLLKNVPPPPGLTLIGAENDCDASTDVPSSQADTDLSATSNDAIPEENLFRFMAGRGSAPLQQQVAMMSSAIGSLQAKLTQLEGKMLQNQVVQMQQMIEQLSEQCFALESGVNMPQQPVGRTPLRSKLNAQAAPYKPMQAKADDFTTVVAQ